MGAEFWDVGVESWDLGIEFWEGGNQENLRMGFFGNWEWNGMGGFGIPKIPVIYSHFFPRRNSAVPGAGPDAEPPLPQPGAGPGLAGEQPRELQTPLQKCPAG